MTGLTFTWDPEKERLNQEKHDGITFQEAQSVFYDENARLIFDPINSNEEDRFIILGFSQKLRLLVVCHCYRENDLNIRIISARKANSKEEKQYERYGNA